MAADPIILLDNTTYRKEDVSRDCWDALMRLYKLDRDEARSFELDLGGKGAASDSVCPIEGAGYNALRTTNLVGYLQVDGRQVSILSRFSNPDEPDSGCDFFLDYMLSKVAPDLSLHAMRPAARNADGICGALIDCAVLWECYLATLLDTGFVHTDIARGCGVQRLFRLNGNDVFPVYPDFISKDKPRVIADAKYKIMEYEKRTQAVRVASGGEVEPGAIGQTDRNDFFQMLAYLFRFKSDIGFLIYPRPHKPRYLVFELLEGVSGMGDEEGVEPGSKRLVKLGMGIPDQGDYVNREAFAIKMQAREEELVENLCRIIGDLGSPVGESNSPAR